jgi:hypothetical protein
LLFANPYGPNGKSARFGDKWFSAMQLQGQ